MPNTSKSPLEIVVADATPLRYLVLIEEIDVLQKLYGSIAIPAAVFNELTTARTPQPVGEWIRTKPNWLTVYPDREISALPFPRLGPGERQAIALAAQSGRRLLLTDDLRARVAAESMGLQAVPTIRLLSIAAGLSLLDFDVALNRLLGTNFRVSAKIISQFRAEL